MGGNAFIETRRADGSDYYHILQVLQLAGCQHETSPMGSTIGLANGTLQDAGDIDIMVFSNLNDERYLIQALKDASSDYREIGSDWFFLINGVQVDVTFVRLTEIWKRAWISKASYVIDKYPTLYRNELLFCLAKYLYPSRIRAFGKDSRILEYERYNYTVKEGIKITRYSLASKRDPNVAIKNPRKMFSEQYTINWNIFMNDLDCVGDDPNEDNNDPTFMDVAKTISEHYMLQDHVYAIFSEFLRNITTRKKKPIPLEFLEYIKGEGMIELYVEYAKFDYV